MNTQNNPVLFKYPLGAEAMDVVTKFKGVIVYRVQHLTGCDNYGLQPPINDDGELPTQEQFDENRLSIIKNGDIENKPVQFKHPLGLKCEDKLTGFKGIMTYRVELYNGMTAYGLQPTMKKGKDKVPEQLQFDTERLVVKGEGVKLEKQKTNDAPPPGGPQAKVRANNKPFC